MNNFKNNSENGWNEQEEAIFARWRTIGLSHDEKEVMLQNIRTRISPVSENAASIPVIMMILDMFRRPALMMASVSVFLIATGGFSVALAAQGSLPGEWLYPVKVRVNEPAEGLLHSGSKKSAFDWEYTLIERRMQEADALAEKGRLGENEQETLDGLLNEHVREARKDGENGEAEEASRIRMAEETAPRLEIELDDKGGKSQYCIRVRGEGKKEDQEDKSEEGSSGKEDEQKDGSLNNNNEDSTRNQSEQIKKEQQRTEKKNRSGSQSSFSGGSVQGVSSSGERTTSTSGKDSGSGSGDKNDSSTDSHSGDSTGSSGGSGDSGGGGDGSDDNK